MLQALGENRLAQGTELIDQHSQVAGVPAPAPLAALKDKTVRFTQSTEKERMVEQVLEMLR